jgi:cytochrome c553
VNYNPLLIIRAVSKPVAAVMLTLSLAGIMTVAQATPTEMATYGAPGCLSCHFDGVFTKAAGEAGLAVYLASKTLVCTPPQVLQNNVCVTPALTCPSPQVLQNNVCVTPALTCPEPQVPRNNACVTPAENGRILSSSCIECHGIYGTSNNDANNYPNINGQNVGYLVSALQQYKNGQRSNGIMQAEIAQLSDQDMFDLASYYAGNNAIPSYSTETAVLNMPLVQAFSEYFRVNMVRLPDGQFSVTTADRLGAPVVGPEVAVAGNGLILSGACSACHGRYGIANNSNNTNNYPNISGQKEAYFFNALQEYKTGQRKNIAMRAQIGPLSDQNMRDLAAYYTGNDATPTFSLETQVLNIPLVQVLPEYYEATMTRSPDGNFSLTTVNRLQ